MIGGGLRFWKRALAAGFIAGGGIACAALGITVSVGVAEILVLQMTDLARSIVGVFGIFVPSLIGGLALWAMCQWAEKVWSGK